MIIDTKSSKMIIETCGCIVPTILFFYLFSLGFLFVVLHGSYLEEDIRNKQVIINSQNKVINDLNKTLDQLFKPISDNVMTAHQIGGS